MRFILIFLWLICGICLFFSGCRAVISAEKLEASLTAVTPGTPLPPVDSEDPAEIIPIPKE